ncbi:hypothetical protein VAEKB19_5280005 [Vibrio aestuarianus]|nr:hypothetical protein VAEKB19_5280005 [Vibrio aestuarianus]
MKYNDIKITGNNHIYIPKQLEVAVRKQVHPHEHMINNVIGVNELSQHFCSFKS